jgi:uncharacterized protein
MGASRRLKIAIVGSGVAGLSAAWLLNQRHDIVVYEKSNRVGGHSNTVAVRTPEGETPVDTGFIVFNPGTYPNFVALLRRLGVATDVSDMSFSAVLGDGAWEYAGGDFGGLFGHGDTLLRRRFWAMIADLVKFYRKAPKALADARFESLTLGEFLRAGGYGQAFVEDHILPMAGAIWSAPPAQILDYPARSFVQFYQNHGLLKFVGRPIWRTVRGGSKTYVAALTESFRDRIRTGACVARVERGPLGACVISSDGTAEAYDRVVFATHADQALSALAELTDAERRLLGAFRYSRNLAVLHTDPGFMPRRRRVWSSWNAFVGSDPHEPVRVTYWMNALQKLATKQNLFVTLNPTRPPADGTTLMSEVYEHPVFDFAALAAQRSLWELQGRNHTWFCGAHFGAGFHEDGVQSGLAVAEAIGGVRRPWSVAGESARIPSWRAPEAEPAPAFAPALA